MLQRIIPYILNPPNPYDRDLALVVIRVLVGVLLVIALWPSKGVRHGR